MLFTGAALRVADFASEGFSADCLHHTGELRDCLSPEGLAGALPSWR